MLKRSVHLTKKVFRLTCSFYKTLKRCGKKGNLLDIKNHIFSHLIRTFNFCILIMRYSVRIPFAVHCSHFGQYLVENHRKLSFSYLNAMFVLSNKVTDVWNLHVTLKANLFR